MTTDWETSEGAPQPLGVTWMPEQDAYNFAICAPRAVSVTLLLFDAANAARPIATQPLPYLSHRSGRIWHCRLPRADLGDVRYYAYQIEGLHEADRGDRFDQDKELLDPYAPAVWFPPEFARAAACRPGSNAGKAPLGVLPLPHSAFDWGDDHPVRHTSDAVIYELHVRGFTRRANSGVAPGARGTFQGVIERIPYLKELGVTAVELMPVFQRDPQEGSYWGYMPLHFFSPHGQYAHSQEPMAALDEFRHMVKALHAADIAVLLDVVYNHTTEQGASGPTYSFKGIDNSLYYLLGSDGQTYRNDTGTGNVLRCAHPTVRNLVLDSLRFWVTEMHVDGFRFDLASIFTLNEDGTVNLEDPAIISEISSDPTFAHVRLIAEAWDLAVYQLGRSFPGMRWAQWNARFRDDVRAFVRGDGGKVRALMYRLYGSDDLFPDALPDVYHPFQSVNFVTCHDGFTLYDLVAYNSKHNEANGHGNADATNANLSWNCGWEGDDGVPESVLDLRTRQVKNFCALLFLSNGTPMFCAGDEFMNTQRGNNNPYNQDNETTWLDWELLRRNRDVWRFFKEMIAFRKAHPSLCRSRYWRDDITWYGPLGPADLSDESRAVAFCLRGRSQQDADIYAIINAQEQPVRFTVAEQSSGPWRRVVDTSLQSPHDIADDSAAPVLSTASYDVAGRSVVVLVRDATKRP